MTSASATDQASSNGPISIADISESAEFRTVLREAALRLLAMHDVAPRVVRYVASMQKWLITQAIAAMHFEQKQNPEQSSLTAAALVDFFSGKQYFSKNTVIAHAAEMRAYGLLVDRARADRRSRPMQLSDYGETLIAQWVESHLSALDQLDGGARMAALARTPRLLDMTHPLAIRTLVFNAAWARPPETVDAFVRTESGSNMLHDLISRVPAGTEPLGEFVSLGRVAAGDVSKRHTLSRGHVQRVFARARAQNLMKWSQPEEGRELFVSARLINDYAAWQAIKFDAIDVAFATAMEDVSN